MAAKRKSSLSIGLMVELCQVVQVWWSRFVIERRAREAPFFFLCTQSVLLVSLCSLNYTN